MNDMTGRNTTTSDLPLMPGVRIKKYGLRYKLLFSACCFCVTLMVIEFGGRLLLGPVPPNQFPGLNPNEIEDEELLWRHKPGYGGGGQDGPINDLGFRGQPITLAKPKGTYRILSLGESTTYGYGVEFNETYSYVLERSLRKEKPIQVINGGVRVWSTYQSVRFLDREIERLEPDMVLFYHEVNDFLPTTFRGLKVHGAGLNDVELAKHMQRRSWFRRLASQSRVVTEVRLGWARSLATATEKELAKKHDRTVLLVGALPYIDLPLVPPNVEKPWLANESRLVRLPDPLREKYIKDLISITGRQGVKLVILHPSYPVSIPHQCILTRLADENSVPIIEIEDVINEHALVEGKTKDNYFLPNDVYHPNKYGHQVIANGIAQFLIEHGLLQ